MTAPTVFITTWCRYPELFYGSTLVFDTVRIGFPDSTVVVVENASPEVLRAPIYAAAAKAGCEVRQIDRELRHWEIVEAVTLAEQGPVVVLDSDIVFWERVDGWDFGDALMAGRYLPDFADPFSGALTLSRLHSSHLWFPRPMELRARIAAMKGSGLVPGSLFEPRMLPPGWWRWDTTAALFHALGEDVAGFSPAQLGSYDHLFCGSHLQFVAPHLDPDTRAIMEDPHTRARTDPASLKGIWRVQEQYFRSRPWSGAVQSPRARPRGAAD